MKDSSLSGEAKQSGLSLALDKLPTEPGMALESQEPSNGDTNDDNHDDTPKDVKKQSFGWKEFKALSLTPTHPDRQSLIKETMASSMVFHIIIGTLPLIALWTLPFVTGWGGFVAASLFFSWGLGPLVHRLLFNSWL